MFRKILVTGLLLLIVCSLKSQEYLDWKEYERLYKYVESMPGSLKDDPELIVGYLEKAVKDKRELIEIIYYWMADNISYDVNGYLSNVFADIDGLSVLRSGKSVCQGYAGLFKLLCNRAGIECVVISGYAKGYGYAGARAEKPNHAWNAVKLDGRWKLVDATWGSGYVTKANGKLIYRKMLDLGYLFSKPEGFIIQHFPEEQKWQLLSPPVSMDEFYSKEMDGKLENIQNYLR